MSDGINKIRDIMNNRMCALNLSNYLTKHSFITKEEIELLPCPFCGSEAKIVEDVGTVGCTDKDCILYLCVDYYTTDTEKLVKMWNRRA